MTAASLGPRSAIRRGESERGGRRKFGARHATRRVSLRPPLSQLAQHQRETSYAIARHQKSRDGRERRGDDHARSRSGIRLTLTLTPARTGPSREQEAGKPHQTGETAGSCQRRWSTHRFAKRALYALQSFARLAPRDFHPLFRRIDGGQRVSALHVRLRLDGAMTRDLTSCRGEREALGHADARVGNPAGE